MPHSPKVPTRNIDRPRNYKSKNLSPFTQKLLSGEEIPPLLIPTKNLVYEKKNKKRPNKSPIRNEDIKELLNKPKRLNPINRHHIKTHKHFKSRQSVEVNQQSFSGILSQRHSVEGLTNLVEHFGKVDLN